MANPQAEHGFVMIAVELFAALMVADLPNRCMIVLAEHLLESYGPSKNRSVFLDPATIEGHTRLHRNNARRAINELLAANILQRTKSGAYRFNKDFDSWIPGQEPFGARLNGGTKLFTDWAEERHGIRMKPSKKDPIQQDSDDDLESTNVAIQADSDDATYLNPTGLRYTAPSESNGIGPTVDASNEKASGEKTSGLAPARASEEFRLLEFKNQNTTQERVVWGSSYPDPNREEDPGYPPDDGALMIHGGDCEFSRAEAEAIWCLIWKSFGKPTDDRHVCLKIANGFYQHQAYYPANCWRAAISETVAQGVKPQSVRYLETLAAKFLKNGIPQSVPIQGRAEAVRESAAERKRRELDASMERRRIKDAKNGHE